jgi:hypothetical protein
MRGFKFKGILEQTDEVQAFCWIKEKRQRKEKDQSVGGAHHSGKTKYENCNEQPFYGTASQALEAGENEYRVQEKKVRMAHLTQT